MWHKKISLQIWLIFITTLCEQNAVLQREARFVSFFLFVLFFLSSHAQVLADFSVFCQRPSPQQNSLWQESCPLWLGIYLVSPCMSHIVQPCFPPLSLSLLFSIIHTFVSPESKGTELCHCFCRTAGVFLAQERSQKELHAAMKRCFAVVNSSVSEGMSAAILEVNIFRVHG